MADKEKKKFKNDLTVENRRARFEYKFAPRDEYKAGIVLTGTEIKSIRLGHVGIADAYCYIDNDEIFIKNMRVDPLQDALVNHDPTRLRKLLLKRAEINKISGMLLKGTTLIVCKLFLNEKGLCKLIIAVAKGKKMHDKRETIKDREADRTIQRVLKG